MRIFFASLFLFSACGPSVGADDAGPRVDGTGNPNEFIDAAPAQACEKMDILFVIDDSGSMSEEQGNLASNFPMFASVINNYITRSGSPLDYRIGVTTTGRDVDYVLDLGLGFPPVPFSESGTNGELLMGCGMTRRWIQRSDTDVSGTLSCIAQVGTTGPGYEMPLLMLDWTLDERVLDNTNAGFLRDDALLAIVVLTDEDDCSREDNNFTVGFVDACDSNLPEVVPVSNFPDFLDNVKGARGRWAAAVIAGPTDCTSNFGDAVKANRLLDFVAQTGTNGIFSSICDGDLTTALNGALDTFDAACQNFPPVE